MPYPSRHITYDITYPILAASSTYKGYKHKAAGAQEWKNDAQQELLGSPLSLTWPLMN